MPTRFPDLFSALCEPFSRDEVKQLNKGGKTLSFISARTAANRLDEILGNENWKTEFRETQHGLICRLWYRIPGESEWLWKEDGGGFAGMSDSDDNEKSGYSSAFKRAAALLGVARYLYRDGTPDYGTDPAPRHESNGNGHSAPSTPFQTGCSPAPARPTGDMPRTGKGVWARMMETSKEIGVDLKKPFADWKNAAGLPRELDAWNADHIAEAMAKVAELVARYTEDESQEAPEDRTPPPRPTPPMPRPLSQQSAGSGASGRSANDPLWELKDSIRSNTRVLAAETLGRTPTDEEIFQRINIEADACLGRTLNSLRDCTDRPLLRELADHLANQRQNVEALRGGV